LVTKQPDKSPLVQRTAGTKIDIELRHPLPYELDGGARPPTDALKVRVEPGALPVCTPLQNTLGAH
jgi:diacylglycerol kinase family enzyme